MEGNGLVVGQLVCCNRCTSNIGHMLHCITVWLDSIVCPNMNYNGGQKCWDLSSDITKTSDPSPPTPNKVEFGAKWVKLSAFLATTLLGEVGGRRDEPKAEQKNVLRSRILRNYCLQGLFHTVPSSFVLHCSSKYYFRICSHFTEEL